MVLRIGIAVCVFQILRFAICDFDCIVRDFEGKGNRPKRNKLNQEMVRVVSSSLISPEYRLSHMLISHMLVSCSRLFPLISHTTMLTRILRKFKIAAPAHRQTHPSHCTHTNHAHTDPPVSSAFPGADALPTGTGPASIYPLIFLSTGALSGGAPHRCSFLG